jgi:hypothetical protein
MAIHCRAAKNSLRGTVCDFRAKAECTFGSLKRDTKETFFKLGSDFIETVIKFAF